MISLRIFQVRINAAYALKCVERRSVLGNRYQDSCLCTAKALDTAHLVEGEVEEIQHKTDLIDQVIIVFKKSLDHFIIH